MNTNSLGKGCPFCDEPGREESVARCRTFLARHDKYPISPGHTLLVPRRHVADIVDLTAEEREDLFDLLAEVRGLLQRRYSPDGFNIGINIGAAAGQTIEHLHIHVIPRYLGDVENPRGGVRGVVSGFGDYPPEDAE